MDEDVWWLGGAGIGPERTMERGEHPPLLRGNLRNYFPFWEKPREHLRVTLTAISDSALSLLIRPGGRSVGDVLRHILGVEEALLFSAVQGIPYSSVRPENWSKMSPEEKVRYYRDRFPHLASIVARLDLHTRMGIDLFSTLPDSARSDLRKTPWDQEVTVHYIFWHLEEHLVHHRAQVYLSLIANGIPVPEVS